MKRKKLKEAIEKINNILEDNGGEYRLCCKCGKPLTEGWYYGSTELCCSDQCGAKHEGVSLTQFKAERENITDEELSNWDEGYYTTVPV